MTRIATFALALALFVQPLHALALPNPPSGFTWQQIPDIKAAFLRPDGWFFTQESTKGTLAYFITKEDINRTRQFDTGLTVNVFRLKKDSAVDRGKTIVDNIASQKHVEESARSVGPFQEFSCLSKDTDASGTIVMYTLTVANPKTNTLYMFIFESPEANWDAAWKIGKPIIDSLAIDDGV